MSDLHQIAPLIPKDQFMRVPEVAHLAIGGEAPMLHSHLAAINDFFALKSNGFHGREVEIMAQLQQTRERAGKLLGVAAAEIAFLNSASEGLGQLVNGLCWQTGDNVVVEDIEFPSSLYHWTRFADQGVEVRIVRQDPGPATLDKLAAAVDSRTRVITTSQVSYLTGRRYDLAALRAIADQHDALLSIDATHAAGVVPVQAEYADILVSSCYKFLLATHGAAIFYRNPQRLGDLPPQTVGWHSVAPGHSVANPTAHTLAPTAARYEAGNPPFMALALLNNALATLEDLDIARIEQHVLALGSILWPALAARGLTLLTPQAPADRAANICFAWPDPATLVSRLAAENVLVWGGDGRIRVSFHAYNDSSDIDRLLTALDKLLPTTQ